jgi:hypothetical protein
MNFGTSYSKTQKNGFAVGSTIIFFNMWGGRGYSPISLTSTTHRFFTLK